MSRGPTAQIAFCVLLLFSACARSEPGADVRRVSHITAIRNQTPDTSHEPQAYREYVTAYVNGRCHVHGVAMIPKNVPVSTSTDPESAPEEIRATRFPFAPENWRVGGGKVEFREVEMFSCSACEQALAEWKKESAANPVRLRP